MEFAYSFTFNDRIRVTVPVIAYILAHTTIYRCTHSFKTF